MLAAQRLFVSHALTLLRLSRLVPRLSHTAVPVFGTLAKNCLPRYLHYNYKAEIIYSPDSFNAMKY